MISMKSSKKPDPTTSPAEPAELSDELAVASPAHRRALIVIVHVGFFLLSIFLSYCFAYKFRHWQRWMVNFLFIAAFTLTIKLCVFGAFRLFHGWWRYVGLKDIVRIVKASHWSTFLFAVLYYSMTYLFGQVFQWPLGMYLLGAPLKGVDVAGDSVTIVRQTFPAYVILLDWVGTITLVAGSRIAVRLYHEEMRPISAGGLIRLLVLGAGNAGESVVRDLRKTPVERYEIVGFLDDSPAKQDAQIHGIPVLGATDQIKAVCEQRKVDEVLIAIPSATRKQMRHIIEQCEGAEVRFRTVPTLADLVDGKVSVNQIRDVDINDLLGREPIELDTEAIEEYVRGKRVLISGAGGSIGSEMCRQICRFSPSRLILIEQAENNLFDIENELRRAWSNVEVVSYICDVYDRRRTMMLFATEKPDAVFHAAAHKHVPLMEANPCEAIKNNVFGSKNVADAALAVGTAKFVMISTDKAVNPTSIMGCSKRVAEIYIQGLNRQGGTQFVTVRFGNVLDSAGSVVPTFRRQIAAGGPVTVTHPEMVRYFMTIPEASQLVLQAGSIGGGGEVFVLDMGEPVKIVDLARDMVALSGFKVGEDIDIVFTGMRPGEKLFEELSTEGENIGSTKHEKIFVWKNEPYTDEQIEKAFHDLEEILQCQDRQRVAGVLQSIVPEYTGVKKSAADPKPATASAGD